ncbi:MAG: hypothetical protein PHV49_01465, partial [Alistipes sp.]|nr:hypothetical protein [Alistipes sp.]
SSYSIFSGTDEIKFTCGDYTLSNMATNRWSVMASQVSTSVPSSSLSDYKSQWTGFYTIIQSSGTQGYESARKATYSVSTTVMNGITMYHPEDPMTISTPEPFQYNPQCSTTAPVGSGQMLISLDKDSNLENFTEVIILGTDLNTCYPKTRIKYNGSQNDYDIK